MKRRGRNGELNRNATSSKSRKRRKISKNTEKSDHPQSPHGICTIESIPTELQLKILAQLDNIRDILNVMQLNNHWKRICMEESLWKSWCEMRGYNDAALIDHGKIIHRVSEKQFDSWMKFFVYMNSECCAQCMKETDRKLYGDLPIPFCVDCRDDYIAIKPYHKFVTKSYAKQEYGLNEDDLRRVRYGFCSNPLNPDWSPMHIYPRSQVEQLCIEKYGSVAKYKKRTEKRHMRQYFK